MQGSLDEQQLLLVPDIQRHRQTLPAHQLNHGPQLLF